MATLQSERESKKKESEETTKRTQATEETKRIEVVEETKRVVAQEETKKINAMIEFVRAFSEQPPRAQDQLDSILKLSALKNHNRTAPLPGDISEQEQERQNQDLYG